MDIYSYIARELAQGNLKQVIAREKVRYEFDHTEVIDMSEKGGKNYTEYVFRLLDDGGKPLLQEHQSVYKSIDKEIIRTNYNYIGDRMYQKKDQLFVQILDNIFVSGLPSEKQTFLSMGTWVNITNVDNLEYYSDDRFKMMYDVINDVVKKKDVNQKTIRR